MPTTSLAPPPPTLLGLSSLDRWLRALLDAFLPSGNCNPHPTFAAQRFHEVRKAVPDHNAVAARNQTTAEYEHRSVLAAGCTPGPRTRKHRYRVPGRYARLHADVPPGVPIASPAGTMTATTP